MRVTSASFARLSTLNPQLSTLNSQPSTLNPQLSTLNSQPSTPLIDTFPVLPADLLCRLDFRGRFSRLSPAWEQLLGFHRDELMARPFIDFVHPEDCERTLRQNADVRGGGQALAFENRYRCKDGSYRWLAWNAAPDDVERVIYSVAVDITALKPPKAASSPRASQLDQLLNEMKTAGPMITVCAWCHRLQGDVGAAWSISRYMELHRNIRVSHGLCPSCLESEIKPQIARMG